MTTPANTAEQLPFTPPARPEFLRRARPAVARRPVAPARTNESARVNASSVTTAAAPMSKAPTNTLAQTAVAISPNLVATRTTPAQFSASTGIAQALPLIAGYVPVAFASGVLCAASGIPFAAAAAMAIFMYAGSAQFIAVSMISGGAPALMVILTTFIVNFRHFLMSTSIAPKLKHWPRIQRLAFGAQMTDESFAVLTNHLTQHPLTNCRHLYAVNCCAHLSWILGTVLGYQASHLLPDLKKIGADFALPGMFIALIVLQLKDRWLAVAAASAAGLALIFQLLGAGHIAVLTAAVIGAAIAALVESRRKPV